MNHCKLLDGVVVVDAAQGMCTTLIAKFLRELGATVIRPTVADSDPFLDVYPAMRVWREGFVTSAAETSPNPGLQELAAKADVLILGGEDYPGLPRTGEAKEYTARHPRLIALEVTAMPKGMPEPPCGANELLIQARSGLVWEHYTERPIRIAFNPASYGAVLQGLSAVVAGLVSRERTGRGQAAWTSLFEGALTWAANLWLETERPTPSANLISPKDPWPLILRCADGLRIHIFLGGPAAAAEFYRVLGLTFPVGKVLLWASPDPTRFFGYNEDIVNAVATWKRDDLLKALWEAKITAEAVLTPGECWADAQIVEQQLISQTAGGRALGALLKTKLASTGPALEQTPPDAPPLQGMSVVDFGTWVAGPYSAVVLTDLGADVIKVESKDGDAARGMYRIFSACNRGKRTIRLDMKHPAGADILRKLCERADGVMSNFRLGVAERRGIDAQSLHARRPDLVVLECPAFGTTGPRAAESAFDPTMQAWIGLEHRQGGVENDPVWNRFTPVDYCAGGIGGVAMLAGLYYRAAKGAGHAITSSLVGAALFLLSELFETPDGRFVGMPPVDAKQRGFHPAEALYRTCNGWIAVVAPDDRAACALANALGLDTLAAKPRAAWCNEAWAMLDGAFAGMETATALSQLQAAGVWVEVCHPDRSAEWLSHPYLQDKGIVRRFQHSRMGDTAEIGRLFQMECSQASPSRPAPEVGEHTREILSELGYSQVEIAAFFTNGVVS